MIDFTNVKLIVLTNKLDYDISYISKWCNASKLPSQKYIRITNQRISEVICKDIFEQNKVLDFFLEFDIQLPENSDYLSDKKDVQDKIFNILMKVYKSSIKNYDGSDNNTRMVEGNSNIKMFLSDFIQKQHLKSEDGLKDILISMEISSEGLENFLNLIQNTDNINIKIGLDMNDFDKNHAKLKKVYRVLNERPNLNITLYNNSDFKNFNAIVAKNNFVINYSLDINGKMEIISYSNNEEEVERAYKILLAKFKDEDLLLKNVNSLDMNKSGYRTDFYIDNYFNIFISYGFEFLLPSNIIDKIADKEYERLKGKDIDDIKIMDNMLQIKKLQIEWEEIFHNRNINFFIPKSTLYEYIQTGNLVYIDTPYKMSIEERKSHFKNALGLMKKNPNIKLYIIDGEKIEGDFQGFNLGIYLNHKKFFVKNYIRYSQNLEPYMYTVMNKKIVERVNDYLESLKTMDICKQYTVEELEEKWNNYESMFTKIMGISDDMN
ncbi:hypothetical protein ABID14_000444 [Peptoniphilus olsenii]|uniref:Uncharacterized protein n=1 Tax=Peptoniphilus olsenii TaxID=411570 RepID=A0ABV2JAM3_9FIRM